MDNKNVLTGITRGQVYANGLDNCGGIHNPTGYTRVRALVPWVKSMLSEEELKQLCFSDRAQGQTEMSENETSDEKEDTIEHKESLNTKGKHQKNAERSEDFHERVFDKKEAGKKSDVENY